MVLRTKMLGRGGNGLGESFDPSNCECYNRTANFRFGGAVAQLGARLDGIEEVVGSNPIGSTNFQRSRTSLMPTSP